MHEPTSPAPKEPPFLAIPAKEDPVVKRATAVARNDEGNADQAGLRNAIGMMRQSIEAQIEDFQKNVEARATDIRTQCDMIFSDLTAIRNEIADTPIGNPFSKIHDAVIEAVEKKKVDVEFEGEELMRQAHDAERDYKRFQHEHNVPPAPRTPQNLIITLSILVSLVIGEIILNGFFFMDLTEQGLFGGVFEAFLFAPFNVLAASLVGYYSLRYIRYKVTWMAILAGIVGIILSAFVFGLNVYLAALRLSLRPDVVYDIPELLPLIISPRILEIMDYKSLGILVLGLSLAGVACWKAFRLKDPYPGYDEAKRKLDSANMAVTDFRNDYIDTIDELSDDAVDDLEHKLNDLVEEAALFQELANSLQDERTRYSTICAQISEAYSARQSHFANVYTMSGRLNTPYVKTVMAENAITPTNPAIEKLLIPISDDTIKAVFDSETSAKRYVNEQEKLIKDFVIRQNRDSGAFLKRIRAAALALAPHTAEASQ